MRRLEYVGPGAPAHERADMVLCNEDGTVHVRYILSRPFNRVQRYGEWWRLAGRDRETRELIYLREPEDVTT